MTKISVPKLVEERNSYADLLYSVLSMFREHLEDEARYHKVKPSELCPCYNFIKESESTLRDWNSPKFHTKHKFLSFYEKVEK